MKFLKSENPVPSTMRRADSFAFANLYTFNQYIYTLPDTESLLWYENRDGEHSPSDKFENTIRLSPERTGWGINLNEVYRNGIVLSNSSTAATPTERAGSNTRFADNRIAWWYSIREMWELGTIQFFPEHGDYDGFDWFKINQPYIVTTQGSSGSEMNELHRCRDIVLAIDPSVRRWLIDNKRVGDVLSYLMRSNTKYNYLDPINHRVVVDGWGTTQADIDLAKSLTVDSLPPRLSIHVVSDSHDLRGEDLLPTTSTIRTPELAGFKRLDGTPTRTIEVEIRSDKPCDIHWIKSQGDCTITYQSPDKSKATITIPHQADFAVQKQGGEILSNRVEVIVIGHDGTHCSSPVFLTEYFTPESREYQIKMNEIAVHADNVFELQLNGELILRGDDWQTRYQKRDIVWKESNVIEAKVTNIGGPGGFYCESFVGDVRHATDETWLCSLDGVTMWVNPVVTNHIGSPWEKGIASTRPMQWIWHPQAGEYSTVYFRKTIGAVVPTPSPEPQPEPVPVPSDLSQRVAALEATLAKIREALK